MSIVSPYDKWDSGITNEDLVFWIPEADFYKFPHIYYYNSWEDLFQKIINFQDPNKLQREAWLEDVKKNVLGAWKEIFQTMFPGIKPLLHTL